MNVYNNEKIVDKIAMGNRIYTLRKKKKLSQMKLGEQIDLTKNSISNIELGKQMCGAEKLECLAHVLETTATYLLYGEQDVDNKVEKNRIESELLKEPESVKFSFFISRNFIPNENF